MSLCSSVKNVPMVSSNNEQHNQVKSGHILILELQDILNSHGMRISEFQADSDISIEKHSNVPKMNHVLGSNDFFLFTFDSVDRATNVLERAPWHMAKRPLVLKRWQPNMQF
jgi:hypothetical protein